MMPAKTYNVLFLRTSNAARWRGHPLKAHRSFEDPAAATGSDTETRAVFDKIFRQAMARIQAFVGLPLHNLGKDAILPEISKISKASV